MGGACEVPVGAEEKALSEESPAIESEKTR